MEYTTLLVEHTGATAVITLNRPKQLNALSQSVIGELKAAFTELGTNADVRAIILTGSGDRAFAAGADIGELAGLANAADGRKLASGSHELGRIMAELPQPVIAAINGFALGGGLELALACDIRIAADSAQLGLPEVTLGVLPGWGGTQRLPRLVGAGMAKLLMMTGERIDAAEALRIGLVERVVSAAELQEQVHALAAKIAALPAGSITAIKQAVNNGLEMPLANANAYEAGLFGELSATEDAREGTRAFVEKRKPEWRGR
jgi:enoyl-CoA hydratase